MRTEDQQRFALECLKISDGDISRAVDMLSFITGEPCFMQKSIQPQSASYAAPMGKYAAPSIEAARIQPPI